MTDQAEQILIRTLLYPVIFESNMIDGVDRVIQLTQEQPAELLKAIRRALAASIE